MRLKRMLRTPWTRSIHSQLASAESCITRRRAVEDLRSPSESPDIKLKNRKRIWAFEGIFSSSAGELTQKVVIWRSVWRKTNLFQYFAEHESESRSSRNASVSRLVRCQDSAFADGGTAYVQTACYLSRTNRACIVDNYQRSYPGISH